MTTDAAVSGWSQETDGAGVLSQARGASRLPGLSLGESRMQGGQWAMLEWPGEGLAGAVQAGCRKLAMGCRQPAPYQAGCALLRSNSLGK